MTPTRLSTLCVALSTALVAIACGGNRRALVAGPEVTAVTDHASAPPYVVRMSDGARDWEVEFPAGATGYEVRIPLRGQGGEQGRIEDLAPRITEADRELLSESRRQGPSTDPRDREGVSQSLRDLIVAEAAEPGLEPEPGDTDATPAERGQGERAAEAAPTGPTPSPPSYLHGISEVRRLYRTGNPEVAMIRLTELLRSYPDDVRLLAMKGTLWLRLGHPDLARRAWTDVLRREPDHPGVQSALRQLNEAQEGTQEGTEED